MQKIIILEYEYKNIKGKAVAFKNMSTDDLKRICLQDAINKGATFFDDVKILKREDFEYERI